MRKIPRCHSTNTPWGNLIYIVVMGIFQIFRTRNVRDQYFCPVINKYCRLKLGGLPYGECKLIAHSSVSSHKRGIFVVHKWTKWNHFTKLSLKFFSITMLTWAIHLDSRTLTIMFHISKHDIPTYALFLAVWVTPHLIQNLKESGYALPASHLVWYNT